MEVISGFGDVPAADPSWPLGLKHRPWQGFACRIGQNDSKWSSKDSESNWMLTKIGQDLQFLDVSWVLNDAQCPNSLSGFVGSAFLRHTHTYTHILSDAYLPENHCGTLNLCVCVCVCPSHFLPSTNPNLFGHPVCCHGGNRVSSQFHVFIRCSDSASDTSDSNLQMNFRDSAWLSGLLRELAWRMRGRVCLLIHVPLGCGIYEINNSSWVPHVQKKCKPDSTFSARNLTITLLKPADKSKSLKEGQHASLNHCMWVRIGSFERKIIGSHGPPR